MSPASKRNLSTSPLICTHHSIQQRSNKWNRKQNTFEWRTFDQFVALKGEVGIVKFTTIHLNHHQISWQSIWWDISLKTTNVNINKVIRIHLVGSWMSVENLMAIDAVMRYFCLYPLNQHSNISFQKQFPLCGQSTNCQQFSPELHVPHHVLRINGG